MNESSEIFLKQLGARLDWIITEMGMSKKNFGYEFNAGKEHKGISRYFSGINMDFTTLVKISNALKLNISFILDVDNADREFMNYADNLGFDSARLAMNIKKYREKALKSQLDLDVFSNIDRTSISKYENRKINPRLDKIFELTQLIGIKPYELFL